jgi:hypothetical protein
VFLTKFDDLINDFKNEISLLKSKNKDEKHKIQILENKNNSYVQHNEFLVQKEKDFEKTINMQVKGQIDAKKKPKFFVNLNKLVQEVNSENYRNKNITLNELKIVSETTQLLDNKIKWKEECLSVFEQVKIEARNYFSKKYEKESIKDFRVLLERFEEDLVFLKVK